MLNWTDMATDIFVAVILAAMTGGTPFLVILEDGVGFGIDFDNAPQSPGYSLN